MSDVKICPTCGSEYPVSERFCPRDGSALRGQSADGDLTGTVIAERYHVMKKLGEGGMGTVYLAEHVKMGRKSALKVMNPGMSENADAIARFNREASNASRLNHPNICAIYDFGETAEGLIYLAMEFIEGESLTAIIEREGALDPARAASILHQAADGLQVAHDYGIVHRDLKPDNIMIAQGRDKSDVVKVVDFGIAKAHTSDAQKVTKTGLVVGTPEYMSPEQLAGDKLDGRSDIYSLALVGFNMLTGTLPFPSKSAQEAMIMRLTDNPKTLADMRGEVAWPAELQAVMDKALARDSKDRYQKASDFGREFSMAIEAMPSATLAQAGTLVLGAQAAANAGAAVPRTRVASGAEKVLAPAEPAVTPVAKKGSGMMIGGGVLVVAVIAFGIWQFLPKGDSGAKPGDSNQVATQTDSAGKAQAAVPEQKGGVPRGGGERGGAGNPQRGGAEPPPITPPVGGAGGGNAQPQPQGPTRKELDELKDLVDALDPEKPDMDKAASAVSLANQLLQHAQGEARGEVLIRRGVARITTGQIAGCKDLTDAQAITSNSTLQRIVNTYLGSEACSK